MAVGLGQVLRVFEGVCWLPGEGAGWALTSRSVAFWMQGGLGWEGAAAALGVMHPTVTKGEAGAHQWHLEQHFRCSSDSLRNLDLQKLYKSLTLLQIHVFKGIYFFLINSNSELPAAAQRSHQHSAKLCKNRSALELF